MPINDAATLRPSHHRIFSSGSARTSGGRTLHAGPFPSCADHS